MIFLYLVSALASNDIRTAECRTACRYIGYNTGMYSNNMCYCMDVFDYEKTVGHKKTVLPNRLRTVPSSVFKW